MSPFIVYQKLYKPALLLFLVLMALEWVLYATGTSCKTYNSIFAWILVLSGFILLMSVLGLLKNRKEISSQLLPQISKALIGIVVGDAMIFIFIINRCYCC